MVALGLLLLAGAGLTVLVGFFANNGADHAISGGFELFGYDFNSSTGRLFLFGAIVGVVGMLGLNLLLAGLGRGVKHKVATRRERRPTGAGPRRSRRSATGSPTSSPSSAPARPTTAPTP